MIILDAGHGGLFRGHYVTSGKRATFEDFRFNEGVINRAVVNLTAALLDSIKIPCHIVAPENKDIPLHTRVNRINEMARAQRCFLLSVHHNAHHNGQAKGFELFTSPGLTLSDEIAEFMGREFRDQFQDRKFRTYSTEKLSKEARFQIITKTSCPAVLSEWGFMTNEEEARSMASPRGIMMQAEFWAHCLHFIYEEWIK